MTVIPKAQQIKFHIEKNKTFARHRRGYTWFYFDDLDEHRRRGSIDRVEELVRYCKDYRVLDEYAKGRFNFVNPTTGEIEQIHGINNFATKLREHPELVDPLKVELLVRVKDKYGSQQTVDNDEESAPDETEGKTSREKIESLADDFFGEHTVAEAGHDEFELPVPAQTDGEEVSSY